MAFALKCIDWEILLRMLSKFCSPAFINFDAKAGKFIASKAIPA
jgi:hypothetical protein